MNQLVDRLVGTRLKESIDRRVRREVGQQERALLAGLRTVVSEEIRRQQRAIRETVEAALSRSQVAGAAEIRRLRSERDALRRDADVDFTSALILGADRRYDRRVTPAGWSELAAEIKTLTDGRNTEWSMRTAYRTLLDHETRGLGRVAGSPYNIVGKLTAPLFLEAPAGPILEIGTLFGLFSPALVQQFRRIGQVRPLTVIDPLAGHSVQPGLGDAPDPTGTPVTEDVARYNFRVGGLADDEVRLVQGLSTDPAVQASVGDQCYAVVVVDGDHSEEGVYADLQWVESITPAGAVVVLDGFGDARSLGVERAARRYLAEDGPFDLLGCVATSGYLRRR